MDSPAPSTPKLKPSWNRWISIALYEQAIAWHTFGVPIFRHRLRIALVALARLMELLPLNRSATESQWYHNSYYVLGIANL